MNALDHILTILVHLIREVHEMNAQVTALVNQVANTVSVEAGVVTALTALKAQIVQLQADLATAVANGFTADDVAALTKAVSDLSTSATALAAA